MADVKKYKKKDGTTAYQFRAYLGIDPMTGRKMTTTRRGFNTAAEAKTALRKLLTEVDEGTFKKVQQYKFREVFEMWKRTYEPTVKEVTFLKMNQYFNKHILPYFGNKYIDKIDTMYCEKIVFKWGDEIPSLQKLFKAYTSKIFEYGIHLSLMDKNPMQTIKIARKKQEIKDDTELFYSREELNVFLTNLEIVCNYKVFTFFRLLAYTGIRKGEAFALDWSDIDFKKKTLRINKTVTLDSNGKQKIGTPKTASSNRVISLDKETLDILKNWRKQQLKDFNERRIPIEIKQLIFASPENKIPSVNTATNWKNDFHERYNMKQIKTHGFRHTHASLLFEAGATIKEVQDRLGHSDIQTTMNIYTHVTQSRKDSTASNFANYMDFKNSRDVQKDVQTPNGE